MPNGIFSSIKPADDFVRRELTAARNEFLAGKIVKESLEDLENQAILNRFQLKSSMESKRTLIESSERPA